MSRISLVPIALAVALAAAAPGAWAQERDRPAVPFVQVTVTAKGEFAYDRVTLPFQFASDGASSEGVTRELAQKTTRALDMLKLAGVADNDIVISGPQVSVRYEIQRERNGTETRERRVPAGFTGHVDMRVTLGDLERAPKLFASIAESGALLSPPEFSVSKEDEEERKLGTQAVKSGMEQARALIEAAGGKPGKILSIIDSQPYAVARADMSTARMKAFAAAPPPPTIPVPMRPGKATLERSMTVQIEVVTP